MVSIRNYFSLVVTVIVGGSVWILNASENTYSMSATHTRNGPRNYRTSIKTANSTKLSAPTTCPPVMRYLEKCSQCHRTALASFPGSGNTWTRHLLQLATGTLLSELVSLTNSIATVTLVTISNC